MNQTLWIGALALSISAFGGCANAQEPQTPQKAKGPSASDQIQPMPEAPTGPSEAVTPAPFEKTVWRAGKSGDLRLTGPLANYRGSLIVRDFAGKTVWEGSAPAAATSVPINVSKLGLYTLQAGTQKFSFGVVPNTKPAADQVAGRTMLGLCTHFGPVEVPEESFKILAEVGVDAVRDEMAWGAIEKEKGVYNFKPNFYYYNGMLKKYGIPLHYSHSYGNPLYPQVLRYPAAAAAQPYANAMVAVLKEFGDNIISVEVLNEPNKLPPVKDYAPIPRATVETVRAAGFKQPIVAIGGAGPGGGGMVPGYARAVFKTGARADGFSQHPYMAPFPPDTGYAPGNGPANLDAALERAENVVKDFDLQGSWITELGWAGWAAGQKPTAEDYATPNGARAMVTDAKQAAFTARTLLIASKYPHLKAMYLYDFKDDGPIELRREHRFGLVKQDLQPKMGFQAFAIAKDFLSDKTFVKTFRQNNALLSGNVYRDKAGDLWLAAWTMEILPGTVDKIIAAKATDPKAPLPTRYMDNEWHVRFQIPGMNEVSGYDWQGAPIQGAKTFTATSLPMYLKVGRDADKVGMYLDGVKQVIDATKGFPTAEVDAAIERRNIEAEANAKARKEEEKAAEAEVEADVAAAG